MLRNIIAMFFVSLMVAGTATAQYRQNDEKYISQTVQAYDDPTRVSPNMSISEEIGSVQATIEWGAPAVRGRRLTAGLISTYKVWRTGANEATVIHFSDDVLIEGELLEAGTYSLFTIGGKKKWTIILNADHQQWGAFTYDRKEDALRVKVDPGVGEHTERLSLNIIPTSDSESILQIRWGTISVDVQMASAESS